MAAAPEASWRRPSGTGANANIGSSTSKPEDEQAHDAKGGGQQVQAARGGGVQQRPAQPQARPAPRR